MPADAKRGPKHGPAANLTVSSKRQVTIPAAMARELGLKPGDKLVAHLDDGRIVMRARPANLLEYLDAFPTGFYGRSKEEIDAYVREQRRGWDRRARIAEGDAYAPADDSRFDS
jgi:AbrB family looped-hinge helix DNA binding protein